MMTRMEIRMKRSLQMTRIKIRMMVQNTITNGNLELFTFSCLRGCMDRIVQCRWNRGSVSRMANSMLEMLDWSRPRRCARMANRTDKLVSTLPLLVSEYY